MMKTESKTQAELERNFVEAFERLARANVGFDEGRLSEAPNIAKEVHSLIDETKNRSLLRTLGRSKINFISSAQPQTPRNLAPEYRLIHATIGLKGMDYRPFLSEARYKTLMPLEQWNDEVVLALARTRKHLSRRADRIHSSCRGRRTYRSSVRATLER
jgi:hypothetical protein